MVSALACIRELYTASNENNCTVKAPTCPLNNINADSLERPVFIATQIA